MFRDVFWTRKPTGNRSRNESPLRCSFCNKSETDVKKLIAGPTVFICDECVAVCNEIIADSSRRAEDNQRNAAASATLKVADSARDATPSYAVTCSLCDLPVTLDEVLSIPERGFLCVGCASAVQAAFEERGK